MIFLFVVFILIKILKEYFLELYKFVMRFIQKKQERILNIFLYSNEDGLRFKSLHFDFAVFID